MANSLSYNSLDLLQRSKPTISLTKSRKKIIKRFVYKKLGNGVYKSLGNNLNFADEAFVLNL